MAAVTLLLNPPPNRVGGFSCARTHIDVYDGSMKPETTMGTIVRTAIAQTACDMGDWMYKLAYRIEGPCQECGSGDWEEWDQ